MMNLWFSGSLVAHYSQKLWKFVDDIGCLVLVVLLKLLLAEIWWSLFKRPTNCWIEWLNGVFFGNCHFLMIISNGPSSKGPVALASPNIWVISRFYHKFSPPVKEKWELFRINSSNKRNSKYLHLVYVFEGSTVQRSVQLRLVPFRDLQLPILH